MINKFLILSCLCFLMISTKSFAQDATTNDELADRICKCFESNKKLDGNKRMNKCFRKVKKHFKGLSELQFRDKYSYIITRVSKTCAEYHYAFEAESQASGEWKIVNNSTESLMDTSCNELFKYKKFYYLEPDTTWVTIKDGVWDEKLKGTYFSRLKFIKKDSCSFDLQFIESNDPIKKYYSRKDEIYHYTIKSKRENYFIVSITTAGVNYEFKLHFK